MLRVLGTIVFLWAGFHLWQVFSNTPVFNADARAESAAGGWRLQLGSLQFDRGTYLFQLGYGYATANENFNLDGSGDIVDDTETRNTQAIALLRESLSLDPGNAHAWAQLAWAETGLGNTAAAREAMAASWQLAPYNSELSVSRPDFLALVDDIIRFEAEFAEEGEEAALPPLTEAEITGAGRDIALLADRDYRLAEDITSISEVLAPLLPPREETE